MSTVAPHAPPPAYNTSSIVLTRLVGELRTNLAVVGPTLRADAHYVVRYGRDEAPAGDMGLEEFPWTADGARRAHAKFTALVSAASVAQSEMPAARAQVQA